MKLSVVIPVYNTSLYIDRCLKSILQQQRVQLEIIVVDDGSTDNSLYILNKYVELYDFVKVLHTRHMGQSYARNLAMQYVTGDFVTFVDSDDFIDADLYRVCIPYLSSEDTIIRFQMVDFHSSADLRVNDFKFKVKTMYGEEILKDYWVLLNHTGASSVCNHIFGKKYFKFIKFANGFMNEDILVLHDILSNATQMFDLEYVGYYYFQNSTSLTRSPLRKKDFDLLHITNVALDRCDTFSDDIRDLAKQKHVRSYFTLLAKGAYYGVDRDIDISKEIPCLIKQLRKNVFFLMKTGMPINRKIAMVLCCINYSLFKKVVKVARKLRGIK